MNKITLEQLLDTFSFGNPNKQQIMVYYSENYYYYNNASCLETRSFEDPEFTIGCSTTVSASSFIKEEILQKKCEIIDICADGNIRVVLNMEEDDE